MTSTRHCPACGSSDRVEGLRVTDNGDYAATYNLSIHVDRDPSAMLFTGTERFHLQASVCADCGHVAFAVDNPRRLVELYRSSYGATPDGQSREG